MPYNVAKEAVRALIRAAAVEWARYGILCHVIYPAARSAAYDQFASTWPQAAAAITRQIPDRRIGEPQSDIGGLALFLVSEDCAQVVAMTIHADGGSHHDGVAWRPDGD
ncbi:SDR family oxidoreductase [Pseudomonas sp. 5P_3.1_Bac2]|uniref:SDR family oxidoreductase n=1 Tax=Pseudomonas sp. 5P_3.1_Bac2 TaxID=2971617 RepID=UPI0021C770E1|nr:SDR family oxidoreductase [Pseudomonas sp. 5P_3.1_Bac2]MCU1717656.1 SDR family oxidoreductase [Pseudomonas sp. 5P_3.1_Bac2]